MRRNWMVALLLACAPLAWASTPAAIEVLSADGRAVSLSAIAAGKPVAVVVMKGTWCAVCTDQLRSLEDRSRAVAKTGGLVIGLSPETPDQIQEAAAQLGLGLPIYADPSSKALIALGFSVAGQDVPMPGIVFLDKCGEPRAQVLGRSPGQGQDAIILEALRKLAAELSECAPQQA